jgi:hypothetical protein
MMITFECMCCEDLFEEDEMNFFCDQCMYFFCDQCVEAGEEEDGMVECPGCACC